MPDKLTIASASDGGDVLDSVRVDRSVVTVTSLENAANDLAFWLQKTPQERFEAMELLRIINYGYDPATARLQRVLTVTQLGSG